MSEALTQLFEKTYLQHSSEEVREQLKILDEKAPGYISDLAERPEYFPGGKLLKITSIYYDPNKPIFGLFTFFDIETDAGKVYNYQYFGWKQGPNSGTKALVGFVEERKEDGKQVITHLCFIESFRFAPGKVVLDLVGGFSDTGEIGNATLKRELEEELGVTERDIIKIIPLGRIMVDSGLTNNHPSIAIVQIRSNNSEKFARHKNTDPHDIPGKFKVYPWDDLGKLVKENDDGFFLAALTRWMYHTP